MSADLILAALLLGLSVAAPVGPVSLAAIRTGLVRGPVAGWLVGLGAATADAAYIVLTYIGVVPALARLPWVSYLFGIAGGALLARMAWSALRAAWRGGVGEGRDAGRSGAGAFLWGLGITAVNPATIFSWLALGGAFAATYLNGVSGGVATVAFLLVGLGSALWFSVLALLVAVFRRWAAGHGGFVRGVNAVSGAVLLWFSISLLIRTFA